MSPDLTELEDKVMQLLLQGDDPVLSALREQLSGSIVKSRELTGFGFYTTFTVPDSVVRIPGNRSFNFGDVVANIDSLDNGAGFVLFIKDGVLDFLEGYTYDEPWPKEAKLVKLSYSGGDVRDWDSLRKKWL